MKKKRTVILLSLFLALSSVILGTTMYFIFPVSVGGTVKIGDNVFTNDNIVFYHQDARIPILQTLTSIGFDITWLSDTTAVLSKGELQFYVDLSTPSLENNTEKHNLLLPPAGYTASHRFCEQIGDDIFMKASDFANILNVQLAMEIDFDIDVKSKSIEFQID